LKIILFGANGFLGQKILDLASTICSNDQFIASDLTLESVSTIFPKKEIDITNKREIRDFLFDQKPDLVILTSAITYVDKCEKERTKALNVNAIAPKNIANYCSEIKSKLVFISTDFVFDGIKGDYTENDHPNPVNYYGKTKNLAENYIKQSQVKNLICRTSVLYGWPKPNQKDNFFSWAYKKLENGKQLKIVSSQYNNPTLVNDLARAILNLRNFEFSDLIHTCGSQKISRFDFIQKICKHFDFNEDLVKEVLTIKQDAKRPKDVSMSNSKIKEKYRETFNSVYSAFELLKMEKEKINF